MAVDPDLVEAIAASVADIYREAETSLARLVARHLAAGLDSPTAERKLGGIRALRAGAQAIIAALEADSGPAIRDALAEAYRHGWDNAVADLPAQWFPRSGIGQAAARAAEDTPGYAMVEVLATALHRDAGAVHRNVLRNVDDAYRSVQAAAAARILTGSQTRLQAAQSAWQRLTDRGLTSFTDRAGRRWRLSSYVEMAARTNAARAATTAQVDRLDTLGVDLVYVSNAAQECRLCRPYEGRILRTGPGATGELRVQHAINDGQMVTVDVLATLEEARLLGFQHPNCRHSVSAYLPGVTKLPAQPTEDPDGDTARQRQRELERHIRKYKERQETALDEDARKAAGKRTRGAQAALRDHLAAHPDLKRLRYREQIGAGNIPPAGRKDAAGDLGPPSQPSLDGGPAAAPPRRQRVDTAQALEEQRRQEADARRPGPDQPELEAPEPAQPTPPARDVRDVRDLSDDDLEAALLDAMGDDFDEDAFAQISAEIERRETERSAPAEAEQAPADDWWTPDDEEQTPELRRVDELVAQGWEYRDAYAEVHGLNADDLERQERQAAVEGERRSGETLDQTVRRMYDEWVYQQVIAAEDDTRGVLLNREGIAAGIDPISLFSGPRDRARKYASEELKRWWLDHPRMTHTEFKADALGRDSDQRAARRSREGGGGREFGL